MLIARGPIERERERWCNHVRSISAWISTGVFFFWFLLVFCSRVVIASLHFAYRVVDQFLYAFPFRHGTYYTHSLACSRSLT